MSLTPEQVSIRDRLLKLELEHGYMRKDVDEVLEAIHKLRNAIMALQGTLEAFKNQGKGAKIIVTGFLSLGGLGWLAGLASFTHQFLTSK